LFSGSWTTRRLIQTALKAASTAAAPAQDLGVAASGHLLCVAKKAEVLKCPLCSENDKIIALQRNVAKAQKQTFAPQKVMSVLPLKADIRQRRWLGLSPARVQPYM
jgi:hypothetical protein